MSGYILGTVLLFATLYGIYRRGQRIRRGK